MRSAFDFEADAVSYGCRELWWSSQTAYLSKDSPAKIETAPVVAEFAKPLSKARLAYLKFIAEGKRQVIRRIIMTFGIKGFG